MATACVAGLRGNRGAYSIPTSGDSSTLASCMARSPGPPQPEVEGLPSPQQIWLSRPDVTVPVAGPPQKSPSRKRLSIRAPGGGASSHKNGRFSVRRCSSMRRQSSGLSVDILPDVRDDPPERSKPSPDRRRRVSLFNPRRGKASSQASLPAVAQGGENMASLQDNVLAAKMQQYRRAWWVIDPRTSKRARQWDSVTSIALIFTALVTPYEVAYLPPNGADALFIINRLVDLVFVADMVLQFCLMYQISSSALEGVRWEEEAGNIARHYLRGWFGMDLFSVAPSIFDIMPVVQGQSGGSLSQLKVRQVTVK